MIIECFSVYDIDYSQFSEEEYFNYLTLDWFSSLPAPSAKTLGSRIMGTLIRPIVISANARAVAPPVLASLAHAVIYNMCMNNESCKPPVPILFYGANHGELTQHIADAQLGQSESMLGNIAPMLLTRNKVGGYGRSWLNSTPECNSASRHLNGEGKDCDEYPFNSSIEGGPANYKTNGVSLRFINRKQNRSGGSLLGGMYQSDRLSAGEKYLVFSHKVFPRSFYLTRQGKVKTTEGPDPDEPY